MPQIMEPDVPRDAGLPQGPGEAAVRQVIGIERLPVWATEDQRSMRALGEPLERPRERGQHVDGPLPVPGLKHNHLPSPQRPSDMDLLPVGRRACTSS